MNAESHLLERRSSHRTAGYRFDLVNVVPDPEKAKPQAAKPFLHAVKTRPFPPQSPRALDLCPLVIYKKIDCPCVRVTGLIGKSARFSLAGGAHGNRVITDSGLLVKRLDIVLSDFHRGNVGLGHEKNALTMIRFK